jgi:hypothetical protein
MNGDSSSSSQSRKLWRHVGFTIEAAFFAHRNRDDILFRTGLVVEVVVHRVVPAEVVLVPLRLDDDGEPRVARDNLL